VSAEKLAGVAKVSASTVRRAEKEHPSVTPEMYDAILSALTEIEAARAASRRPPSNETAAQEIERHAHALLALARKLRGSNPARGGAEVQPGGAVEQLT
jgi:transcriptional regulator with XRE-family HTH domain